MRIHQVELEVQNRELRESQNALEESRSRYADLYDFAPVAYLTLDLAGVVREINLTGAKRRELRGLSALKNRLRLGAGKRQNHALNMTIVRYTSSIQAGATKAASVSLAAVRVISGFYYSMRAPLTSQRTIAVLMNGRGRWQRKEPDLRGSGFAVFGALRPRDDVDHALEDVARVPSVFSSSNIGQEHARDHNLADAELSPDPCGFSEHCRSARG